MQYQPLRLTVEKESWWSKVRAKDEFPLCLLLVVPRDTNLHRSEVRRLARVLSTPQISFLPVCLPSPCLGLNAGQICNKVLMIFLKACNFSCKDEFIKAHIPPT